MSDQVPVLAPCEVPRRVLGIRIRRSGQDVLLGFEDNALLLEGAGALIYRAVDGTRSVGVLARLLAHEYGIEEEEALADVSDFLADLTAQKIIEFSP
ncbi:PqqD family protein [Streptomyces resistomycificus]|uniref:Pyrroloquinoline quinone biosynthesis protein PqqD n=1 Tax=Streptomyces resistomycificus TaxID=67356 RepID=A0A0L8L3E7_9ACTN|nr:PqqD family protein [Streptomyces resistomycificus]KOG32601.1 hypothetical protein ADK37_26370 [Streptomyces resistomycificus]KUN90534.1 hypothetical protein AQJ84_39465 [Streptomyces resistomycificus]